MNRRSFLAGILAAACAPAIARAGVLMPVKAPIWVGLDVGVDDATGILLTGEIGRFESIRFIEAPHIQRVDPVEFTPESLRRIVQSMRLASEPRRDFIAITHPELARDLRRLARK